MTKLTTTAKGIEPGDRLVLDVRDVKPAESGKVVLVRTGKGEIALASRTRLEVMRPAGRAAATAGGEKGEAIKRALLDAGKEGATTEELAEEAGASVARVYEVVRACHAKRVDRGKYYLPRRGRPAKA